MKERWLPVGVLAAVLFAINAIARVVARLGPDDDSRYATVSLFAYAAIGLVVAGVAFLWSQSRVLGRWSADIGAAALVALVLIQLVGPFISGQMPFGEGAGAFFAVVWQYAGFVAGGAALGYLVAIVLGRDHRSKSLLRAARRAANKPGRVIRG